MAEELNRHSCKKTMIEDTAVMELSPYATVDVREINGALDGLERLLPNRSHAALRPDRDCGFGRRLETTRSWSRDLRDRFGIPPLKTLLSVLLWGVLALTATSAVARSNETLLLDIERQGVGPALMELGGASGVQIMLAEGSGAEVLVDGLQGEYRFEEALTALLTGTDLEYEFASENTVVVSQVRESAGERRDEDEESEEEEMLELEAQRVTGSRMKGGDPTSRIISITAEQIERRGVSDAEELFRPMPWAFPSSTKQVVASFELGASYVNLRNLGTENTLVLINGRRVSSIGGDSGGAVNLLNIPLSAIERVDIDLGSASAVYGSDAIGGVVNFITKKRDPGLKATVRREYSATDADRRTMSVQGAYSWETGRMTWLASHDRSEPINNRKVWTSNDFRDQFGPEYDRRDYSIGQPGVVCPVLDSPWRYYYPLCDSRKPYLQLRPGHSGLGATVEDFTTDIAPTDYVTPYNGSDSTTRAAYVRAEQSFGENLMLYGEVLYSELEAFQETRTQLFDYYIPASNAYNPFGHDVLVNYYPQREVESDLFPPATTVTQFRHSSYTAGVLWTFGDGHELDAGVTHSRPKTFGTNNGHSWYRTDQGDPTAEAFYRTLESTDPSVAFNPFGDGTAQGSDFGSFLLPQSTRKGGSAFTSAEALLRGHLFEIWGGPIDYVLGGEYRVQKIERAWRLLTPDSGLWIGDYANTVGHREPKVGLGAAFMELGLPLVGEKNARPGLRGLHLSLQGRRDLYEYEGADGGSAWRFAYREEGWRFWIPGTGWSWAPRHVVDPSGSPNVVTRSKGDTTPRVGLRYEPTETFALHAAWTKSFRPPNLAWQFSPHTPTEYQTRWDDPLHPSGETTQVTVRNIDQAHNPDIESEYGEKYSLGFDFEPESIRGLRWTADWSRIDHANRVEISYRLRTFFPRTYAAHPELVVRDENGFATTIINKPVNISLVVSEMITTSVRYAVETRFGRFDSRITYAGVLDEFVQLTRAADREDRVSTADGSDKYKVNGQLTWMRGRFEADLFVYHRAGYSNDTAGPCRKVVGRCQRVGEGLPTLELGSLTTFDIMLNYDFGNGTRVRAGARNLFRKEAPTISYGLGYDRVRWDARSRVLFLDLRWET
ncbi:MAG: TonB-dependent receptor [Gammaproteobacteria bacterium]|nr:TonB-dependent receptor [Gammaproteobacteria bacterium]